MSERNANIFDDALDTASQGVDAAAQGIGDVAKGVGDTAVDVAKGIGNAASDVKQWYDEAGTHRVTNPPPKGYKGEFPRFEMGRYWDEKGNQVDPPDHTSWGDLWHTITGMVKHTDHEFDPDYDSCIHCGISSEGKRFACRVRQSAQSETVQPILQQLQQIQNQLLQIDNNQDADINNAANLVNQAVSLLNNVLAKPGI